MTYRNFHMLQRIANAEAETGIEYSYSYTGGAKDFALWTRLGKGLLFIEFENFGRPDSVVVEEEGNYPFFEWAIYWHPGKTPEITKESDYEVWNTIRDESTVLARNIEDETTYLSVQNMYYCIMESFRAVARTVRVLSS